jgi:hypothetical protein
VAAVPAVRDLVWSPEPVAGKEQGITIDAPEKGKIPICVTLHGSASLKDGSDLWIGVEGYDFTFWKAIREEGTRWRLNKRVGNSDYDGRTFLIHAFYLDERQSRWMEGLAATGSDGKPVSIHAHGMPPGAQERVTRTVVLDGSNDTAC